MTRSQQKLLNSICGDLSRQVCINEDGQFVNLDKCYIEHRRRIHKDDFRHALAGKAKGEAERYMPDWDDVEKKITLSISSLRLTLEEADFAIELGYELGSRCDVRWTLSSDSNDYSAVQYENEARN